MLSGVSEERGGKMARLRNRLKKMTGSLLSDFTVILDADVVFTMGDLHAMIKQVKDNVVMVTPYTICRQTFSKRHYYDTLALGYKDSRCPFKICKKKECKNGNLNLEPRLVDFAFGSFAVVRTDVYNKVTWGNGDCEHYVFCRQIRLFGNILLDPRVVVCTTGENGRHYQKIARDLLRI